jgi:hypothetical protein
MNKTLFRKTLHKVAQMVYDQEKGPFSAGLCYATINLADVHALEEIHEFYSTISKYIGPRQSWVAKPGTKWKQRAMFALLIAEAEK